MLHNIAETLNDEGPQQEREEDDDDDDNGDDDDVVDGDRPLLPPPGVVANHALQAANIDANEAARKRAGEEKRDEVFRQFCVSLNLQ